MYPLVETDGIKGHAQKKNIHDKIGRSAYTLFNVCNIRFHFFKICRYYILTDVDIC